MDFIRVELEEKYISYVEPREECIAFSVYIKSGDFPVVVPLFIL